MTADGERPNLIRGLGLGLLGVAALAAAILYARPGAPRPAPAPSPPPPVRVAPPPPVRLRESFITAPLDRTIHVVEDADLPHAIAMWRAAVETHAMLAPLKGGGLRVEKAEGALLTRHRIFPGAILREVNGRGVGTVEEVRAACAAGPADRLSLVIEYQGRRFRMEIRPASRRPSLTPPTPGANPIDEAIRGGSLERVRELIDWGADFDEFFYVSPSSLRPLYGAVLYGRTDIVRLLLQEGAGIRPRNPRKQEKDLLWVALQREKVDPALVRLLLEHKADPNVRDEREELPALLLAARKNSPESVRALVEAGAEVNAADRYRNTALTMYAAQRRTDMVSFLVSKGAGVNLHAPLIHAARGRGDVETLRVLLERGADVERRDEHSSTALMHAAGNGDLEAMTLLLDQGADPNARRRSTSRDTALHAAAAKGQKDAVDLLLRRKAAVDGWALVSAARQDKAAMVRHLAGLLPEVEREWALASALALVTREGRTKEAAGVLRELGAKDLRQEPKGSVRELFAAIKEKPRTAVEELLKGGVDLHARDGEGHTPLMRAVERGSEDVVRVLLDAGARIDDRGVYGDTALRLAADRGNAALVKLLLERGADPHVRVAGDSLLDRIETYGHPHVEYLLRAKGVASDRSPSAPAPKAYKSEDAARVDQALIEAVVRQDPARVHDALDRKADPDVLGGNFIPVVCMAAGRGAHEIVRALLDAGADVNAADAWEKETALHRALHRGVDMVDLLLRAGADVDAADKDGNTPLMEVFLSPSKRAAHAMIRRSRNPDARSRSGMTALRAALEDPHAVELLLERGADPNLPDNAGRTPLMAAAERGWLESAAALLDGRARTDLLDQEKGWAALHFAAHGGHLEVVKLLVERRADPLQRCSRGVTPADVALAAKHPEISEYLRSGRFRR